MISSKDVNFFGYTYKNFELKKKNTKPKRPTIKSLFEDETETSEGGSPSSQGSFQNLMPPQHEVPEKRNNKFERSDSICHDQRSRSGASAGHGILTGVVIFQQLKSIYESISQTQSQPHEPIFGRRSYQELAHIWNKIVDKTLEPVI
ncbi:putative serine/threonine-protein kinase tricorner-like [Forsythia ovata]|uniref:Serine/threonine-protein kinase tricorner-like n=1 Tax=Forsythia ovata TaxID=205694 RepID=A0ABD1SLL1_9LAMI